MGSIPGRSQVADSHFDSSFTAAAAGHQTRGRKHPLLMPKFAFISSMRASDLHASEMSAGKLLRDHVIN
eukprot:6084622-Amphidinium_carterae.1